MIWNQAQGNWTQFKGKVKEKWGRSTVEGLGLIDGNRDILVGQIQNKYAIAREKAEKRIRDWKKTVGWRTRKVNRGFRVWAHNINGALPIAQRCVRPPTGLSETEGESHAIHNCFSTGCSVAAGIGHRVHGGILYPHPAGRCCCHGAAQPHSGKEIDIAQLHI